MMEQYFALKYYEEVAGWVCTAVAALIILGGLFIPALVSTIKEWWEGRK